MWASIGAQAAVALSVKREKGRGRGANPIDWGQQIRKASHSSFSASKKEFLPQRIEKIQSLLELAKKQRTLNDMKRYLEPN